MLRAVIHFENQVQPVVNFRDKFLKPELKAMGKLNNTELKFIDYRDDPKLNTPLPEIQVAQNTVDFIAKYQRENNDYEPPRAAFVTDLDVYGEGELSYGLRILKELSGLLRPNSANPLHDFLSSPNYLPSLLSIFLGHPPKDELNRAMSNEWSPVKNVTKIIARNTNSTDVKPAIKALKSSNPRVVAARRLLDELWLAKIIALWI